MLSGGGAPTPALGLLPTTYHGTRSSTVVAREIAQHLSKYFHVSTIFIVLVRCGSRTNLADTNNNTWSDTATLASCLASKASDLSPCTLCSFNPPTDSAGVISQSRSRPRALAFFRGLEVLGRRRPQGVPYYGKTRADGGVGNVQHRDRSRVMSRYLARQ